MQTNQLNTAQQLNNAQQLLTEHLAIWTSAETEKKSGRGRASGSVGSVFGIKKLRELILELAVRGKLVPQDANDEPASELLKRIQAEKAKLIAEGKVKKEKPLAPITEDEKLFELPSGWEWVYLDDIGTTSIGLTYSPKDISNNGIPVLRSSNIQGGKIDLLDLVRVDTKIKENLFVKDGDLLICARNGSKALVGKTAMIKSLNEPMVFGAFMAIYRGQFNPYIQTFLISPIFRKFLDGIETTTINQITQNNLKTTLTPLPPLAEQHRIVAKVDALMALCDQLENQHLNAAEAHEALVSELLATLTQSQDAADFNTNWQRIYAHFDVLFTTQASIAALKQTLLQLAVMGKLVPQDPNDEPASELLKRIQAEKAKLISEGKLKKEKPLAPISDDEKPFELPKGWDWARLSYVANLENGDRGKNYPNKDALVKEGVPFVNAGHLENGLVNKSEMTFITEQRYNQLSGGKFIEDDILFCLRGSLGKCAVVKSIAKGAIASSLVIIRINSNIHLNYFYNYLISNVLTQSVRKYDNGTAQPNLSSADLAKFVLPIPPLTEQHRIVAKVDELMALCDQLKTRIQQVSQQQQTIADALVAQAVA